MRERLLRKTDKRDGKTDNGLVVRLITPGLHPPDQGFLG